MGNIMTAYRNRAGRRRSDMRRAVSGILLAVLVVVIWPPPAAAGQGLDRADVVKQLRDKHGERPVGAGIAGRDGILELFLSEQSKSWTVILTKPNGKSVMIGAGSDWFWLKKRCPRGVLCIAVDPRR